jgi:hypothetical protein
LTPDSFNSYNCSETLMNWQAHVPNIFGIGFNVTFIRFLHFLLCLLYLIWLYFNQWRHPSHHLQPVCFILKHATSLIDWLVFNTPFPNNFFLFTNLWENMITFLVHLDQRSMGTIAITWRPSSVVCKLFTLQTSSPKPQGQLEPNLAGMFLRWSSITFLFFVPVQYSTRLPGPIVCSDWLKFQIFSSVKLMNWLYPNYKRMTIGMSFIKFMFFMRIGNPRWPPPQDID